MFLSRNVINSKCISKHAEPKLDGLLRRMCVRVFLGAFPIVYDLFRCIENVNTFHFNYVVSDKKMVLCSAVNGI